MKAVIFGNGEPPSRALAREAVDGAGLVVAADGGADGALAVGIMPDLVVGDLDSLSNSSRSLIGAERVVRDEDPDKTDLQKALEACIARSATEALVLGVGGGRADHALANLSMLLIYRDKLSVKFVDERFTIIAVRKEESFVGPEGTVVSLVALGECSGVTTKGLRWDLSDATLHFSPLGVHNEIRRSPVTIAALEGDLLVFHGRWVEKHR